MNKKSMEYKLSTDLDAYLAGIENKDELSPQEYKELLELGKLLIDNDFSKNSNKESVYNQTLKNIRSYRVQSPCRIANKFNRIIAISACLILVCVLSISLIQPSLAHNVFEKIIKTITLGHINVVQFEPQNTTLNIPHHLKGKIFDEKGDEIKVFSETYTGKIYTAQGQEIIAFANGEPVTKSNDNENILVIRESHDLSKYTCFEVILPSYLPEGYQFDRAEFYKNEDGIVENTKYINLYFTNSKTGKYIYMQQRYADKETAYTLSTNSKVEQIEINGVKAILSDNRGIDWERDNVLYGLSSRGEFTKDELIKIAESIQ
ncbi:DUF4367 domain-containing protein [Serpentinicella alkaliphila]|uniref:Uncharacterized protein DUF4367 n=1 Tax=Serpentinicella alkaliphila TaxID=1734049 RepID=A0A4R2TT11_9FIRM|nr:DUF4367 domain-containing protein [Serpentinicella alkaliphila]QUH25219.1 DUF4367 domain-containing protein [Serpentinicella alkaliphila]TCQ07028.1 uncharacterized protein DUF4367 [Serpentinicella alkaliphila]